MLARSISAQLTAAFATILAIAFLLGAIGLFGTRSISRGIETASANALPLVMAASKLEADAAHLEILAADYMASSAQDTDVEREIAHQLEILEADIAAVGSAALAERHETLSALMAAALDAHAAEAALHVSMDGESLSLVQALAQVQLGNARYLKDVREAIGFGVFDAINTDPAATRFAVALSGFKAPDQDFADLLAGYAEAEAGVVTYVGENIVAKPEMAESQLVRMSSRQLPRMDRALDALIEAAGARYGDIRAAERTASERLRENLGAFREGAVEVQRAAVAEMQDTVATAQALSRQAQLLISVALGLGLLLAGLACLAAVRRIGPPIRGLADAITALADRRFDITVPHILRQDEVGRLARSAEEFRDRLAAAEQMTANQEQERLNQMAVVEALTRGLRALSDGDLSATLNEPFPEAYEQLRQDFNATIDTLNDLMGSVIENATEVQSRAEEISSASDDLSRRTENQAATLEQTAAALDELTSSVRSAADGAAEVEKVAKDARGNAENSRLVVEDAIGAMSEIKKSSDGINQIIAVIDDIAFQTNLLALNAGVEAARAGEAGRGFAVVSSEVRALAQRSSDAAKEIKALIGASSDHVNSGVALVNRTGDALTDIVERVTNIAGLIGQIATGAQEQSMGLGEINVGVSQLDMVTQQNAAMVEEATAASATLKHEAQSLQGVIARFRLKDGAARSRATTRGPLPAIAAPSPARADPPKGPEVDETQWRRAANDFSWHDF